MEKIKCLSIPRVYAINGQHAEQVFRFTCTGKIFKADNVPAFKSADCGDIQIKSARATVCKGTDIDAYLEKDVAKRYAYVTADFETAYILTKAEWKRFVNQFGTVTVDSKKNGGGKKIRLGHETKAMREWLEKA